MEFVVAKTDKLEAVGFDTTEFRRNVDGTQVIAHVGFIKTLVADVESNDDFTIYTAPSTELAALLVSSVWSSEEEEEQKQI